MGRKTAVWLVLGVAFLVVLQVVLSQAWPRIDDNDPPPGLEQQLAVAAAVTLAALPHLIAIIARRRDRRFLKLAGAVAILLTFASIISPFILILAIPLWLIPGAFYLVRGLQSTGEAGAPSGGLIALCLFLTFGAVAAFFLTEDPRCTILVERDGEQVYETPETCSGTGTGRLGPEVVEWSGSSDTIAWHESSLSLLLSGAVLALSLKGARRLDSSG